MNGVHEKNNIYKNGEYIPAHRLKTQDEKAKEIEPTRKQVEYRDDLYKFCLEKGVIRDGFLCGRTRMQIRSNIRALKTILYKNGLADEFYGTHKPNKE